MSTSLFRHFYFRFACSISHWIWPCSAVETGGRRSELEMFAEYKLQPVDILREEALLSLPSDLERDSNPRRVRPAALHLHAHMRSHTTWLFEALTSMCVKTSGVHPCSNAERPTGHCFTHSDTFRSYFYVISYKEAFEVCTWQAISNGPKVYNECRALK